MIDSRALGWGGIQLPVVKLLRKVRKGTRSKHGRAMRTDKWVRRGGSPMIAEEQAFEKMH